MLKWKQFYIFTVFSVEYAKVFFQKTNFKNVIWFYSQKYLANHTHWRVLQVRMTSVSVRRLSKMEVSFPNESTSLLLTMKNAGENRNISLVKEASRYF